MGKKSAPAPPDYTAAAEATAQGSRDAVRDQTYANRIDQTTPWGSLGYETYQDIDPATGEAVTRWRQNETLTPEAQAALDSQLALTQGRSDLAGGMMGDIEGILGTEMDFGKYGGLQSPGSQERMTGAGQGLTGVSGKLPGYAKQNLQQGINFDDPGLSGQNLEKRLDYSALPDVNSPEWTRSQAERSLYERGASRLDPRYEQEAQALDVRLRSQGLNPGDEAYDAQMGNFDRSRTDAYQALSNEASMAGSREAQSMFGMESNYRGMYSGEEDRQKQFRNEALSGQFGIDAQRQAQLYGISEGQAQFTNQARSAQMQSDLAARLGEGALQSDRARVANDAASTRFNQQMQQTGYNANQAYRESDYANMLRETGMNEESMQRQQRLNEVNALISGQQVSNPQFNNFSQQSRAQGTDYLGAANMQYQGDLNRYATQQSGWNSLMGGLGSAAGIAGMFG